MGPGDPNAVAGGAPVVQPAANEPGDGGAAFPPPPLPPEDPFGGTIPLAGQGRDAPTDGTPEQAAPPALGPGSDNFDNAFEAGRRALAEQDAAAALDDPMPAPEPAVVDEPEPVVVDDAAEESVSSGVPDVVDITDPDEFPNDSKPMPLPKPVEPPVTEAPPPAPAAPVPPPVEAPEVPPVESEVAPERPVGVQDPADLREAAGHYRAAADLLEQAADEIEAGDAALAGESDPEDPAGQGGGVDTDTVKDGTAAGAGAGSTEGGDVDLDGVRVTVDASDLKVTVNGEPVAVEFNGTVDADTAGDDTTEAPTAA